MAAMIYRVRVFPSPKEPSGENPGVPLKQENMRPVGIQIDRRVKIWTDYRQMAT